MVSIFRAILAIVSIAGLVILLQLQFFNAFGVTDEDSCSSQKIYGQPSPPRGTPAATACAKTIPGKYLLFDKDQGGFSNIVYGMIQAAIIACMTGWTLVLPPASAFWMKDWGPNSYLGELDAKDGQKRMPSSLSRIEDYLDMFSPRGLGGLLHVITFEEFLAKERERLHLPWSPQVNVTYLLAAMECSTMHLQGNRLAQQYASLRIPSQRGIYFQHRAKQICGMVDNNVPDFQAYGLRNFRSPKACPFKNAKALHPMAINNDVLYFPMDVRFMMEGVAFPRLFECKVTANARPYQILIMSHICFNEDLQSIADHAIEKVLGGRRTYVALHYRTKEFDQYKNDSPLRLREIVKLMSKCISSTAPINLYVATDMDRSWFNQSWPDLKAVKALFWDDLADTLEPVRGLHGYSSPEKWAKVTSIIEMAITESSGAFIGSKDSTFTKQIVDKLMRLPEEVPWTLHQSSSCAFTPEICEQFRRVPFRNSSTVFR